MQKLRHNQQVLGLNEIHNNGIHLNIIDYLFSWFCTDFLPPLNKKKLLMLLYAISRFKIDRRRIFKRYLANNRRIEFPNANSGHHTQLSISGLGTPNGPQMSSKYITPFLKTSSVKVGFCRPERHRDTGVLSKHLSASHSMLCGHHNMLKDSSFAEK